MPPLCTKKTVLVYYKLKNKYPVFTSNLNYWKKTTVNNISYRLNSKRERNELSQLKVYNYN